MNIRFTSGLLLFTALVSSGQVELQPPAFGCHIAGEGRVLRLLSGVRNAVSAVRFERGISAAACDGNRVLYHTGTELVLVHDGKRTAHPAEGRLLLALDYSVAVAVDVTTGSVLLHQGGEWSVSPLQLASGIRAIRLGSGHLWTLDANGMNEWDPTTGALLRSDNLAVPDGPAVLLAPDSVLAIADGSWMHCTTRACTALAPAPASATALHSLAGEWVAVSLAPGLPLAVRLHDGALESFFLPGESAE